MIHTGRPTTDKKGESIRIRLNEEMRLYINDKSLRTGKTISEIFREYITKDMKESHADLKQREDLPDR